MAIFDVYVVTVYSADRIERSVQPVGQIDAGLGYGASERLRAEARKKFNLAPNQSADLVHAKRKRFAAANEASK